MTKGPVFNIHMSTNPTSYRLFFYPAGEMQVRIEPFSARRSVCEAAEIHIHARLRSMDDTMALLLLSDAVYGLNPRAIQVAFLPYLPYARADRRFVEGDCLGVDVFGRLLRWGSFIRVSLDVHSVPAIEAAGVINASPLPLIEQAIFDFARRCATDCVTVLFPDEGASKRYALPMKLVSHSVQIELKHKYCSKRRNSATGALEGFDVPRSIKETDAVLIVDDICDGGGTFNGIAKAIELEVRPPMGLYVTHGIFSKGLEELLIHFRQIYTSDSWLDLTAHYDRVTVFPAAQVMWEALKGNGAKK